MTILLFLIPFSLLTGVAALGLFFWAQRSGQFDDPVGAASRILRDDDMPKDISGHKQ
jgi:cbb3-type cytochrome oxidase maturation protein